MYADFNARPGELPHPVKIVVPGNHEFLLEGDDKGLHTKWLKTRQIKRFPALPASLRFPGEKGGKSGGNFSKPN
jgi:hypothetical protein